MPLDEMSFLNERFVERVDCSTWRMPRLLDEMWNLVSKLTMLQVLHMHMSMHNLVRPGNDHLRFVQFRRVHATAPMHQFWGRLMDVAFSTFGHAADGGSKACHALHGVDYHEVQKACLKYTGVHTSPMRTARSC